MPNSNAIQQSYQDDLGNTIILGKELARGGEGMVCLVQGNDDVVAKIYLDKALLKHNKSEKIKAMCNLYDPDIAKYNALPQRIIFNAKGKVVGFIMEKVANFKEIHNLYGISTKRKLFDFADWKFMVHTAKNLAIAIDKLHSKNIIIGDINQGNILVDNQAMIKLIDCDSYQVEYNGKFYLCEVGVPEYTSPELQGKSFNGIQRTKNHDCFGLAIMIFKILMFGKHPYSGVGAPPEIENAIKQGCYCFGSGAKQPNPNSAQWYYSQIFSTLNYEIKEMFERAFSANKNTTRPTAEEWIKALDTFEGSLLQCSLNSSHKYSNSGNSCIWCKLAKQGFSPFVKPTNLTNSVNNKPNYQQTPYPVPNTQQNFSSQPSAQNWFNTFFKNHPYLTVTAIFFIIFAILSGVTENSSNNYDVPKSQYEDTQTNNIQTQTTTPTKEVNKEIQPSKELEQKTVNTQPEVKEPVKKIEPTKTVPKNNLNPRNPDFTDPMNPHAFDNFITKDTPKKTVDIINQATQPKKNTVNTQKSKPKNDLEKSTDDFFE